MIKTKLRLLASLLFLWAAGFINWNFYGLCLNDGKLIITESIAWIRWLEFSLSCFITVFALVCAIWFWHEYIKESKGANK